jgi:hypothetical protein
MKRKEYSTPAIEVLVLNTHNVLLSASNISVMSDDFSDDVTPLAPEITMPGANLPGISF